MNLTSKVYADAAEKKKDFWKGVGLWFALNIAMGVCSWLVLVGLAALIPTQSDPSGMSSVNSILTLILSFLPFLVNIGLIIYLAFTRNQMALGMLAGFGIALAITICLGLIFMAVCFVALGNSSG